MQFRQNVCNGANGSTIKKKNPLEVDEQIPHHRKRFFMSSSKIHSAIPFIYKTLEQVSHPYIGLFSP